MTAPRGRERVDDRARRGRAFLLAGILAAAAAVRFWGLRFGLPLVQARPDEQHIIGKAIGFFSGDLNPHFFDYPTFYLYGLAGLYWLYFLWGWAAGWFDSLAHFVATWPTDWVPLFVIGRTVGAVTGTATVFVVYAIGRRMFDWRVGLVAALFQALAFLHVRDSHYATTDAPMILLMMVAVWFLVGAYQDGRTRDHVLAGVFAGLAMATKYNASMLALPMAAVAVFRVWDSPGARLRALAGSRLLHMLVPFGAVFLAASPYVVLDFDRFQHDMAALSALHTAGMTPPELLGIGWKYHLTFSLRHGVGLPLLGTGLAGLAFVLVRSPRAGVLLAAYPAAYYLVAGSGYTVYVRYVLPVIPYLCLAAAALIGAAADRVRARSRWAAGPATVAMALSVIWPSAASAVKFDGLLARRDSRLEAGDWARAHIPAGDTIYQAGAHYGQLQLEERRPFTYQHWTWDRLANKFRGADTRFTDEWPKWIVVHQSPLPYSHVPERVGQRLKTDYAFVHAESAVELDEPRNVYDVQDAFFLPFGGFERVRRPGPNILIYRRRVP